MEKAKIMVVDDESDVEPLIRQKFRHQIRNNEYEFLFALNGLEALSKLIEHPDISVILSDINMPEMDGLTLLLKVKELKNPALITVIVSAYRDMENIRTAMNRGAFDFITKPINFDDLADTIKKALEEIKLQRQALREQNQIISAQRDLNVAREIQLGILPNVFPPFPHRRDFDIFAGLVAGQEVSGDFYDFFMIDNDQLGFVIGDVAGKGMRAAIFMAVSRTLLHAAGLKKMPAGECLHYVNNFLWNDNEGWMYVTIFYGILNLKTGQLDFANAGHNPPLLLEKSGPCRVLSTAGETVLGGFQNQPYTTTTIQLHAGEGLLLYTDGLIRAFNKNQETFGNQRMEQVLHANGRQPPQPLIQKLLEQVNDFCQGQPQSDDMAVMMVKYYGSSLLE